jgi:Uma2 family endonuclease
MQPSIATAILGCVVLFKFFAPSSFAIDSPPDLVLEVEYSRSAIDKLRLYAGMGVPEFWRYNGSVLRIYTLAGGQYSEV